MKSFIQIFVLLYSFNAFSVSISNTDYSASLGVRSYVPSASLTGQLGHSFKLWEYDDTFYGYIRPSIFAETSAVVNYVGAQLDIYPVSFFGFYIGKSFGLRNLDELGTFNCAVTICDGSLERTYWGTRLALAYNGFFFVNNLKFEGIKQKNRTGIFADENTSLFASAGKDRATSYTGVAGFRFSDLFSSGLLYQYHSMKNFRNKSSMTIGFANFDRMPWSMMVGAGQYYGRTGDDHLTVLMLLKWQGSKGLLRF